MDTRQIFVAKMVEGNGIAWSHPACPHIVKHASVSDNISYVKPEPGVSTGARKGEESTASAGGTLHSLPPERGAAGLRTRVDAVQAYARTCHQTDELEARRRVRECDV